MSVEELNVRDLSECKRDGSLKPIGFIATEGEPTLVLDEDKMPVYIHRANWGEAKSLLLKAQSNFGMTATEAKDFVRAWDENIAKLAIWAPKKKAENSKGRRFAGIVSQFGAHRNGYIALVQCFGHNFTFIPEKFVQRKPAAPVGKGTKLKDGKPPKWATNQLKRRADMHDLISKHEVAWKKERQLETAKARKKLNVAIQTWLPDYTRDFLNAQYAAGRRTGRWVQDFIATRRRRQKRKKANRIDSKQDNQQVAENNARRYQMAMENVLRRHRHKAR